jgi:peptide/nickel transport system substrate-binding protein
MTSRQSGSGGSPYPGEMEHGHSRRDFLKYSMAGAAVLGTGGALDACSSTPKSSATTSAGKPKRGGTLHLGGQGGASDDNLDAMNPLTNCDYPRIYALYDPLVNLSASGSGVQLALAESITPNAGATEWTIKVRPDVVCHNGKSFGAADVLFSLRRIVNPKAPFPGSVCLTPLDLANAKVLDTLTLQIPCKTPFSTFVESLVDPFCLMVPTGYDPKNPVGTGPFKYQSFTAGVQSIFTRNENYWQSGKPYADKLIISDYPSEESQVNGLLGGEVNMINFLSSDSLAPLRAGNVNLVISKTGGWNPITMRVDRAPFNDVRVRQAMKLLIDRPQMLDLVFGGYGQIGNDVFGIFDPLYDHSIAQREQNIDQAKSLLSAAGHSDLTTTLVTSSGIGQGIVKTAEVMEQQAQAAGVTINIDQVTTSAWFGQDYLKVPFGQDYWFYLPYLVNVPQVTIAGGAFNETKFNDAHYTSLYNQALATTDKSLQTELAHEMQMIDYNDGGLIIPYFPPVIDATATNVKGVVQSPSFPLANYDWASFWIE